MAVTNTLTGTTGNDSLSAPGSVDTLVTGGAGNDTITLNRQNDEAEGGAGNDIFNVTGSIYQGTARLGDGNDIIGGTNTGGVLSATLLNNAVVAGNAGDDTIRFASSALNASIQAGQGADSIGITGGVITNSQIQMGKGADTVFMTGGTVSGTTLNGGAGHDILRLGTGIFANSLISLGKGTDSITFSAGMGSSGATIAGGGLADTITFTAAASSGIIYGDANGVITAGTGSGGAADGADLIGGSAASFSGSSIYGGGANDTITLVGMDSVSINGGNGADVIGHTAMLARSGGTINGGSGHDTITLNAFTAVSSGVRILGEAGNDFINAAGTATSAGDVSINGGAGADTITFGGGVTAAMTGVLSATLNGGDGDDVIRITTNLSTLVASGMNSAARGVTAMSSILGNVVYGAGDVLSLTGTNTTLQFASGTNWGNVGGGQIYVASGVTALITATMTAIGSIGVCDIGDDMVIAVSGGGAQATATGIAFIRVLGGGSLINTTVTGQNVNLNSTNFDFSIAAASGVAGTQITFS